MIDINIIKSFGKYYSIKCQLDFCGQNNSVCTATILELNMIQPNGTTSYRKLKTIFHSQNGSKLSRLKYEDLYKAVTKKLIQKYKMAVLNI